MRYAIKGPASGQFMTQSGLIITHTNRREMEFLFPRCEIVPIDTDPADCLPLPFASGMEAVVFPLRRSDFR